MSCLIVAIKLPGKGKNSTLLRLANNICGNIPENFFPAQIKIKDQAYQSLDNRPFRSVMNPHYLPQVFVIPGPGKINCRNLLHKYVGQAHVSIKLGTIVARLLYTLII